MYRDKEITQRTGAVPGLNTKDMKKTITTKIAKMIAMISRATKNTESAYFRFVGFENGKCVYGEWMTPEMANKEMPKHNIYNTLRLERVVF